LYCNSLKFKNTDLEVIWNEHFCQQSSVNVVILQQNTSCHSLLNVELHMA